MDVWFVAAIVAAIAYGLHNVFTKLAAGNVSDSLGAFILEITAAVCILLYMFYLIFDNVKFDFTMKGVIFSILAGLCVGLGTVLYFYIFRSGGELSIAGPLVLVGGILIMAVAGIVFFKEDITFMKVAGVVFGLISLWLLKSA
ncbi:MAG: hypothetical protein KKA79_06990 [Nanoarchaeota archaeon]|nr:hypothetical protein [Nanoarchaeota archaeon]MCG2718940.1 hypothetical protein [Nanoarchaeota archaeon]